MRQDSRTGSNKNYERERDDDDSFNTSRHAPLFIEMAVEVYFITGSCRSSEKSASPKMGKAPKVEMHPQAVELG